MNATEMANKILDTMVNYGVYSSMKTSSLLYNMGVDTNRRPQILTLLHRLEAAGLVMKKSDGAAGKKYRWILTSSSWNRDKPLGDTTPTSKPKKPQLDEAKLRQMIVEEVAKHPTKIVNLPATPSFKPQLDKEELAALIEDQVTEFALKRGLIKTELSIKYNDSAPVQVEGAVHKEFPRVLRRINLRIPVMLIGPAGCGKSYLAEQISKCVLRKDGSVGLSFAFTTITAGMSEGVLTGRLLPTGKTGAFEYHQPEFVNAYENGGVFLLDEMDAGDPNVLLTLNTALAGERLSIPNRLHKPYAIKHPDFVPIAAVNTFGTGADRMYVGRNQIDEAFLDRWRAGQIELDYEAAVDNAMCPDEELRKRLLGYRQKIRDSKLRRILSSRFIRDAYALYSNGEPVVDIERSLFAGWSKDEIYKVKGSAL